MEPPESLAHSQELATFPISEPDQSTSRPSFHFLNIQFNITLPSAPGSSSVLFLSDFPC